MTLSKEAQCAGVASAFFPPLWINFVSCRKTVLQALFSPTLCWPVCQKGTTDTRMSPSWCGTISLFIIFILCTTRSSFYHCRGGWGIDVEDWHKHRHFNILHLFFLFFFNQTKLYWKLLFLSEAFSILTYRPSCTSVTGMPVPILFNCTGKILFLSEVRYSISTSCYRTCVLDPVRYGKLIPKLWCVIRSVILLNYKLWSNHR